MIVFRHSDSRLPFLWEGPGQPPARWHDESDGVTHYFSDTPDGAWAEFIRHEEITDPAELSGVRRALWAVDIEDVPTATPDLPRSSMLGGVDSYADCRKAGRKLRVRDKPGFVAPAAALIPAGASGWRVDSGLRPGPRRDGSTIVLFDRRPDLTGWPAVQAGSPPASVLAKVRPLVTQPKRP